MNRTKSFLKIWVFALSMLFVIALTLGITMAAYNTSRTADGTLSMGNGIIIDYSGFGKAQDGEWQKEQTTTFKLFANRDILPGDTINLNSAAIKKGTNSIDFYARIKFEYKFYDTLDSDITTTVGNEYTNFISTPAFNSAWVDGNAGDGWFYYATGTILNTLPASYVNIFSSSAINVELNVAGFNHEGGGYKFTDAGSNEVTIAKVEATLTLETVQTTGSTWEIVHYTDAAGVVYMPNGDNTWTLTDGTSLSGDSSNTTATYSARIYTSSYSYTVLSQINNQDVVAIADNAFLNASQLTEITIPATVSTVGTDAFTGTGLSTITIEKDNAVVSGIETAGIPSASVLNVPGAVVGDYELTNLASGGVEIRGVYPPSVGLTYSYDSSSQSYTVTGIGTCVDTDIVIPSTYNDGVNGEHDVTSIGNIAFCGCTSLTSVTIPNSVTSIGSYTFENCTSLTSITISNSVISIGFSAFKDCTNLTSITIPNSVTSIGHNLFRNCTGLTSFSGGSEKYTISADGRCLIENDGDNHILIAFAKSGLSGVYSGIPNSVTSIEEYMFDGCTGLTSITIPTSVTSIGRNAFHGCTGLTSITMPNSVTNIGIFAFKDCTSLTSITIPNLVTSIGGNMFDGCTSLTSVTIPNSVTWIGAVAFAGCTGLTSITIPNSVTWIDLSAFSSCTGLTSVVFEGTDRTEDLYIGSDSFSYCSSLATVTFDNWPSGVNVTVGNDAFNGCAPGLVVNIPNQ